MANYTFTASACFDIGTHTFKFTSTHVIISVTATGEVVFKKDFSDGMAFMCKREDFCVGTLTDHGTFSRKVDFNQPKARMWFALNEGGNTFWGSDNYDDQSIYNKYALDLCPIRLTSKNKIVTIECPCDSDNGPCSNKCYSFGK